jgi:tetratricopeptide (TPR) repeat protein
MIKRLTLLILFITLLPVNYLHSQARVEIKMMFYEAESWILFEDFTEALPTYQRLLQFYPTNSNYKYRIGQCYLNIPGEKDKAIGYLEEAVKDINPKYKEGKFKEKSAPYDALYYLANAYRIDNQLDKAIETYELFKKNLNTKIYKPEIVEEQIQSCYNAKELMNAPLYVKEQNLGSNVNENNSEFNPVISDDEKIMIYSKTEAFYDAILYSTRDNGEWSRPINMNEALQIDRDLYPTSLSKDGKTLYLYSSAGYDGIIYSSTYENGSWSPIVKLNDNINTKYWESHATISHDNKKLYFTSNRKSSIGGLDIYVSSKDSTGNWGPAVNLGPVINTKYHENTPFLSKDDKTLFFSSRGHFNIGGYDIFYSTQLDSGKWSVPLNVGYPLNSTDDDVFFKPINEGYQGYLAKYSPDGFGSQDIYRIEIFSDEHPRKFTIRGIARIADLINSSNYDRIKISAIDTIDPGKMVVVYSNPQTGEYKFQIPQGNYEVTYEAPGGKKTQRDLILSLTQPSDSFNLPGITLPKTDLVADLSVDNEDIISVASADTVVIPVKTEPGSILVVEHWIGDSLTYTEKFAVTDSTFNYKMVPLIGDNKVTFKVTDRFSNTTTADVLITRKKPEPTARIVPPEYKRVISEKQIAALTEMQKNRADDELRKIISGVDIEGEQFVTVDDQISYLKEEAAKKGIGTEEVDMLALKVAVMDNVLSQAAVDLLAENAEGGLKKILEEVDIYELNLKTWNDLKDYIAEKSGGEITPAELDRLADAIIPVPEIIAGEEEELLTAEEATTETGERKGKWWILWLLLGAGAVFFFIWFLKKRKDEKNEPE